MKRKPININWIDLEEAFTNQHDELGAYLDTVTGHVVLEGEGDLDDDVGGYVARGADATHLAIHPPGDTLKIEWMKAFLKQQKGLDPAVVTELNEALASDDPPANLGAVLRRNTDERDAWYLYRADRVHDHIEAWLAENGIEADAPPWK